MQANQMCGGTIKIDNKQEFVYKLEMINQYAKRLPQKFMSTSQYQFF